jgi:hypothetical protein
MPIGATTVGNAVSRIASNEVEPKDDFDSFELLLGSEF